MLRLQISVTMLMKTPSGYEIIIIPKSISQFVAVLVQRSKTHALGAEAILGRVTL